MHIKLTVRWTFQTNNYRCRPICFITKIIIGLVSQFMYSLGYSLIVCPYTLDTAMNSCKIIFNVIEIGLPKYLYFGTDMIMRSNMQLLSYAAFSC